jgi:hypothetical protein
MRFFGKTLSLALGLIVATLSGTALAHHGWSWYTGTEFSLTGVIVEEHFGNPHDRLTIEADGQKWNVVLSTPSRSRRAGFGDADVKIGDSVTAYGHRHADDGTFEMKTERLKVGEELYDLYPNRT